jgi:ribosomal-protein-alanine N-acetyltransferase
MHTKRDKIRPGIRWTIRRDMPSILHIEQSTARPRWTEKEFRENLSHKTSICMTATVGERVVGYIVYLLMENKLRILNIAVHKKFRRCGIGTALIDKIKSKLSSHRRTEIDMEISEDYLDALLFFRSQKFLATKVIWSKDTEDSFLLSFLLTNEIRTDKSHSIPMRKGHKAA